MAKPRIFISSTYYDLKYIRAGIEAFIDNMGYEAVLFEKGDITFFHDATLEESCLREVDNADILILVIGGRYGTPGTSNEEISTPTHDKAATRIRSITNKEYEKARSKEIPTFIFIEHSVFAEHRTFRENRGNTSIKYAHVDDPRIYEMLDDIIIQRKGNYIKDFANIEDITTWLRDQWSGMFVDMLRKKSTSAQILSLQDQIVGITDVVGSLKKYNEEIIRRVTNDGTNSIISKERKRLHTVQAERFYKDAMIKWLRETFDINSTPTKIYNFAMSSSNFDDFVSKVDKTIMQRPEFLEYRPILERDFELAKLRFSKIEAEPSDETDLGD